MDSCYNQSLFFFLFLLPFFCSAQFPPEVLDDAGREKLYMHFDKNDYVLGDTIWYKSYLVDAETNMPSKKSGIVYIELLDPQNDLLKRYTYHNVLGISDGFIPTDTAYAHRGIYKIRAYTRWMRNFGDTLFFEKDIRITDSHVDDQWFLNILQPLVLGDSVKMGLHLTDYRGLPLRNKTTDFYLLGEDNHIAIRERLQLDSDGSINVNFNIPEKFRNGPLFVRITDAGDKKAVRVDAPFDVIGGNVDLQFLPESGHLLAGVENYIGFKALASNGLGVDVEGVIKDDLGKEVAKFYSLYKGMGKVSFKPDAKRKYVAYLSNGKQVSLPKVKASGTILQLISIDEYSKDQNVRHEIGEEKGNVLRQTTNLENDIRFQIIASPDLSNQQYYLMCRSKGYPFHQQVVEYKDRPVEVVLPRILFPSGITSFVLFDKNGRILNERAVFMDHNDGLNIQIESTSEKYHLRENIPLKITVKDRFDKPVMGSFSLAVTDMRQVEKDPRADGNIRSYLLLQSELKGNIETPGYYFNGDSTSEAMDALLLTQGFVRYGWDSTQFIHKAEREYTVSGQVIKGINGTTPIADTKVTLFSSKKFPMVLQTVTDANGRFLFNNIPSFDTASFVIQAKNAKDKSFNVSIKPDQFDFAPINNLTLKSSHPNRVFIDRRPTLKETREDIVYNRSVREKGMLNVVEIIGKKTISNSKNLNGAGNADLIFTQEDIKKMPNMNIYEFLKMNIKGYIMPRGTEEQRLNAAAEKTFEESESLGASGGDQDKVMAQLGVNGKDGIITGIKRERKAVRGKPRDMGQVGKRDVYIYIDGESVDKHQYRNAKLDLELIRSENIKGIEVMDNPKYIYKYNVLETNINGPSNTSYLLNSTDELPFFIEVTTFAGVGVRAFIEFDTPGVKSFHPPVFYYGKEFYSPRYETATDRADPLPDLRSTLYWNPLVITNENGEATIDFYSADIPTNYLIVLEGMGLNGDIGGTYKKIEIQK